MENMFYKSNFVFRADRYEEWQGGRCISQGTISTEIIAEVEGDNIRFELKDIGNLRIPRSFDFSLPGEGTGILPDRIQYIKPTDFNPIIPVVCHIFYRGNMMQFVRFAMTNPDRLIEFYGTLVRCNKPARQKRKEESTEMSLAQQILNDLNRYGMLNTQAVFECAAKLYNDNAEVESMSQAKNIAESLRLFVEAYKLDAQERSNRTSFLKCKILMFMSLCNIKLKNINRAYCIARQGRDAIDEAMKNATIGFNRSMLGEDNLNAFIDMIETYYFDGAIPQYNYKNVDPCVVDTTYLQI